MANPYFNAALYLLNNPDVFAAGYTIDTAEQHYLQYGAFEANAGASARNPAPWFDVHYYLQNNVDLVQAGITPAGAFEHFTTYGIGEDRQPSREIILDRAALSTYAAENADLREAFDIDDPADLTPEQEQALANHYYQYGYQEDRPGTPDLPDAGETFTLTPGTDIADQTGSSRMNGDLPSDFHFSNSNETVSATNGTLTSGDVLRDSSTTDNDVLDFSSTGKFAGLNGVTVANIENINGTLTNASGDFEMTNFRGVDAITLTGSVTGDGFSLNAFANSGVSSIDTSALIVAASGEVWIRGSDAHQNITLTTGATADNIDLGDGDNVIDAGAGVNFVSVGGGDNIINTGSGADNVSVGDGDNVIDTGAGSDNVTIGQGNNTVNLGNGANFFVNIGANGDNVVTSLGSTDTIWLGNGDNTIDAGAGNDEIWVGTGDNDITGGAGRDVIGLGVGENVIHIAAGDSGVTTATADVIYDFSTGDNALALGTAGSATNYREYEEQTVASVEDAIVVATAQGLFDMESVHYALISNGVDSFLLIDADLDGAADSAVTFVGVTDATFDFGNIIA